ncbi:MAG: ParB N-terminal domain-containing protein [Patescibacteria group bacterium]|nr:ParB N-terminal domain-containing protein [Patescibacteria group bacterium]
MANKQKQTGMKIEQVGISLLRPSEYNPRKWGKEAEDQLKESIKKFGAVEPLVVNSAANRRNVVIGGHFRLHVMKNLGYEEVPVVYLDIPDIEKEKELNIRLNKNTGEFDWDLLKEFGESFLSDMGFSSEELDDIFENEETPEEFDLQKELAKLDIKEIKVKKGDVYDLNGSRLMCGDSTVPGDMDKLMGREKADLCLTDPPYILDYLHGKKKNGQAVTGFGAKRDRRYLETDSLPDDFTQEWMKNAKAAAKDDFHIIVFENWKNIRTIWNEMEKYWKVKNMIVWHLPNRVQGFAGKYKFFSKHDIAVVGSSSEKGELNLEPEEDLLQNEYETALYAVSGKPHWEGYEKGKRICPTDFVEHAAADEIRRGQGIIFGTKPVEILIPYIKVLTERNGLVLEPFGGSGSTLIASEKLKRRCFAMEKSPVYAEVIKRRWERSTGLKAEKIDGR